MTPVGKLFPRSLQQTISPHPSTPSPPVLPSDRGAQMATAAQAQPTPSATDPVDRWLARRAATNRANSQHSTGPKTESGKQRSSQNALRHGLTSQIVVMPTEELEACQLHLKSFVEEYDPKGATESNLVQALADASWRLNRVGALETNLLMVGDL